MAGERTVVTRFVVKTAKGPRLTTPVEQLDRETGEVVAWFPSQNAAAKAVGIAQSAISKCCHGVWLHCGGYKWRFAMENNDGPWKEAERA